MIKLFCDGCGKKIKVGTKKDYVARSEGTLDYCEDCKGKYDELMMWMSQYDGRQALLRNKAYAEKKRDLFEVR